MELLFEEVFEGLAGIERTTGSRFRGGCSDLGGLLIRSGSSVLFDGGAKFVELAVVLAILGRDAFRDGLRALKLRTGIEEAALLAAVQFGVALGAGAGGIEAGSQHGAAIGAARAGHRANHARSARAEMIVLSAGSALGWFAFRAGLLFFFAIAIAAMAVLAIHRFLRTQLHTQEWKRAAYTTGTVICIQSDCYTWRGKRYFPNISVQRNRRHPRAGDGTTLFLTLWEFEVKSGSEELFEQAYGLEGQWVRLFRQDERYRGTRLLRDARATRVYVTIDSWESEAAYEAFRETFAAEYGELDHKCEGLTENEKYLGCCEC